MPYLFIIIIIAVILAVGYILFTGRAIPNEGSVQGAVQTIERNQSSVYSGLPINSRKTIVVDPSSSSRGGVEVNVTQDTQNSNMATDVVNFNGQVVAPSTDNYNNHQFVQANENSSPTGLRLASCYPKDSLTAEELLPQDNASSQWAQVYPTGEGTLKDKNFLQSGYLRGIDTVGQTLRNANLQLRSEPPNPQVQVSPWLQSTIEPDVNRRPFEIGGC